MAIIESRHDFRINDGPVLHDEIWNEVSQEMPVVVDGKVLLDVTMETLLREFNDEGALVELFIETGLESVENLNRGSDDGFSESGVGGEHGRKRF